MNRGWEFCLEYNSEFVNRHANVVERQQMIWDAKFTQLSHSLNLPKSDMDRKGKDSEMCSPDQTCRRRNSSRTKSFSERSGSDTDSEYGKNCGRRRSASGASAKGDEPKSKIKLTDAPVSTNGLLETNGNKLILTSEQSVQQNKELEIFVHEKLSSRHVVTGAEIRRLFTQHLVECPPGHLFTTGVSDEQMVDAAKAVNIKINAIGDRTVFVMTKLNDKYDDLRELLYENVKDGKGVQLKMLKQRVKAVTSEGIPTDTEFKKILNEMCYRKGNVYYLKGMER